MDKCRRATTPIGVLAVSATALAAAVLAGPTTTAQAQDAEFELKVGFVTFRDQQHQYALFLEEELEAASNGRIDVQIFPRGELGPIPQQIEGVQLGTQAMYIAPSDFFVGLDSRFGVYSVPTLFRDKAHAAAVLTDVELQEELKQLGAAQGVKVVSVFIHSAAHYMAKGSLTGLDDFDGLKMRINATDAERAKMAVFGATGIPMGLGDVLPALQRGEIDGTMSGIAIYANLGFSDFSKTLLKTEDQMLVASALLSPGWLATLPEDLQTLVVETAESLLPRITEWSLAADAVLEAKWAEQGGTLIELSEAEQEKLLTALAPIGDQVTENDPPAAALLARIREVGARY